MYPEFVAVYIGLGVLALLLLTVIVLLSIVLRKVSMSAQKRRYYEYSQGAPNTGAPQGMGVVFCANCGTQYDGLTRICPRCGAPR